MDSASSGFICDWATKPYSEPLLSKGPLPFPFLKQQVPFDWCVNKSHFRSGQASPVGEATGHIYGFPKLRERGQNPTSLHSEER